MSTAFGLNLFLLSHLSGAGQVCALLQGALSPCYLGDSAAPGQSRAALEKEGSTWPLSWLRDTVGSQGKGRDWCAGLQTRVGSPGTRVIHRLLVFGCLGSSQWPWITPVASELECKLVAAGVAGVCASLDPWPCLS